MRSFRLNILCHVRCVGKNINLDIDHLFYHLDVGHTGFAERMFCLACRRQSVTITQKAVIALHSHEQWCTQFCKLLTTSICNYVMLLVNISSINIEDHLFVKPVHQVQQEQIIIHRIR